jgi:hypothetical protein
MENILSYRGWQSSLNERITINEQDNGHCIGDNEIDSVVVTVKQSTKNKNRYSFSIRAFFPSTGSSNKVYAESLSTLKEQILTKVNDNQKERLNRGILGISIMNIEGIWGSASNYLNGPLLPTNWNNRSTIVSGYEKTVPNIKDKLQDAESSNWKKNLEYAKNRGNNFLKWINTSGVKEGITLNSNAIIPVAKTMILDTGGCVDEKRDMIKYKNPGQNLLVRGIIQLTPIQKSFTPEETKKCLTGTSITIGYINDGSHSCDYAIFDVFANDVKVGVANLNNSDLDISGTVIDYIKNRTSDGKKGGERSAEFVLNDKQITKIAENSKDGRVTLSIEGYPSAWYSEKRGYTKIGKTHADTPTVTIKLNGKVRYNKKPQVDIRRGSVKTPIFTFNPCYLV